MVCSNCSTPDERVYLEKSCGGERVRCPKCEDDWPNFLRYPIQPVMDIMTGQLVYRNVITGEEVSQVLDMVFRNIVE